MNRSNFICANNKLCPRPHIIIISNVAWAQSLAHSSRYTVNNYENYKITIEATIVFLNKNVDSMKKLSLT